MVADGGGNGVHVNFWSGHGSYKSINKLNLPLYIHYQKSGDKVISSTKNAYRISWYVLCKLASICGVDTIHTGMWGGYLSDDENELRSTMHMLSNNNVVPALSCGMTAELIPEITRRFGVDYMANVGGAIHEHPDGMKAGALKLRKAIDSVTQ
jgi:ribulose 1,5-bisphosphate carboxylase large subunit-like protein